MSSGSVCYRCNKPGHFARECNESDDGGRGGGGGGYGGGGGGGGGGRTRNFGRGGRGRCF